MSRAAAAHPEPVFVGGSPRSGTHAMGRLVAADPRYHLIAVEVRVHAFSRGIPGLLAGDVELDQFLRHCRGEWFRRGYNERRGLQKIVAPELLESALRCFEATFADDPWEASRTLVRALLDPAAERAGKPSWVEVTGPNIQAAPTLLRLFPNARFINMVRDGRAVVASIVSRVERTNDPLRDEPVKALDRWARRVRASDAAMRSLPVDKAIVMHLEDIAADDRERSFRRLADFLETDDERPIREYLEREISAEGARLGRWRERMPPPEARRVDRRYRQIVRELERDGIHAAPAPEQRAVRLGRVRVPIPG